MKNVFKENKAKLTAKRYGHSLIDKIRRKGYGKTELYHMLARELGIDEKHAHFGTMQRLSELENAIEKLEVMVKRLPARLPIKTPYVHSIKIIKPAKAVVVAVPKVKKKKPPATAVFTINAPTMKVGRKGLSLPRSAYIDTLREVEKANNERHSTIPVLKTPITDSRLRTYIKKLFAWKRDAQIKQP